MRTLTIALLLAAYASSALAQTSDELTAAAQHVSPAGVPKLVGSAPSDRAIAPVSGVEVQATTDDTTASITASHEESGVQSRSWQVVASAPLTRGGGATDIAAAKGFPDAFTLTGKYGSYHLPVRKLDENAKKERNDICAQMRVAAVTQGVAEDDANKLVCGGGNVGKFAPQDLDRFETLFFDRTRRDTMWGATATAGYRHFDFVQTSGDKASTNHTPMGGSLFFGVIPANEDTLFTGTLEYRKKYKENDTGTICPSAGSTAVQCIDGPIGAPVKQTQKLAGLEVRRKINGYAASLKTVYDFEAHHWSADLPIYFVKTAKGGLSGGVRASWEQTKHAQFGLFVGSTFSLSPF